MKEKLTIGKIAAASNVNVETIRFYERKGVLIRPEKVGAFRYYPAEYITKIKFVKRVQELGFTLKEVIEIFELTAQDKAKCSDVLEKTEKKIYEIDQKIKDLKKIKTSLKDLSNCCEDTSIPLKECIILNCFISNKDQ